MAEITIAIKPKNKPRGVAFKKGNTHGNRWKPGESGNPTGRPSTKPFTDAIRKVVEKNPHIPERIAEKFLAKAILGSTWHFNAMADRVEGKPTENVEMKIDVLDTLADRIAKGRKRSGK